MQITATQLKQQSYLLDNVKKEDIIITKRDKPFAVLVDFEKYQELTGKKGGASRVEELKSFYGSAESTKEEIDAYLDASKKEWD